ncbi:hypothetical protein PG999_001295 [Apiospora kogelbergensis]|uniref:Heterokaryon incompatibility domain-containing protein n=1 Tax=Apiospora kogelbergensis TaxID=1337665 RepID=A0AAW0RDW7_9PEZI
MTSAINLPERPIYLDPYQERSFWMLWNWWVRYRDSLEVSSNQSSPQHSMHECAEGRMFSYDADDSVSDAIYFVEMLKLFEAELTSSSDLYSVLALQELRKDAAVQSSCYYTAAASYRGMPSELKAELLKPRELRYPTSSFRASHDYPKESESSNLATHPGLRPAWFADATIVSCPWIADTSGLPFYLWDVANGRTVETKELAERPLYTAVSHTWGRWSTGSSVTVHGLDAWAVPENTLFDVKQLPWILSRVPTSTPYIWFDLVCIPQDNSDRGRDEIARQAVIFKEAAHVVVWFNQIGSWDGLESVMQYMSAIYLNIASERTYPTTNSNQPTGLFRDYDYSTQIEPDHMVPDPWFSSLWTLQEICLRPDMWMCNRDWEPFTVDNFPVPFNSLVALVGACRATLLADASLHQDDVGLSLDMTRSMSNRETRLRALVGKATYPQGLVELVELLDRTGMKDLCIIEKEYILLLGSQRYCKSRRAEAIMSVLDVKGWFSLPDAGPLVLNQYPLEFVREASRRIGPGFFNALSSRPVSHAGRVLLEEAQLSRGTILPFTVPTSGTPADTKLLLNWRFGEEIGNPSVDSWVVRADGSVEMPHAAILVSSHDEQQAATRAASIWVAYDVPKEASSVQFDPLWDRPRRNRTVDLRSWCQTYYPTSANYAVEVTRCLGSSRGLLLKEVAPGSARLYKVGNYMTPMTTLDVSRLEATTASRLVNWTVL